MGELDLVPTDDLIHELADRHREIIIVREYNRKKVNVDKIFVKTCFGKKGREDKGFDLVRATQMLHAAQWELIHDYLDDVDGD